MAKFATVLLCCVSTLKNRFVVYCAEQSPDASSVDMAVAAAQQAAALRAAESRAQAAMMVEAVEDRAYEVQLFHTSL